MALPPPPVKVKPPPPPNLAVEMTGPERHALQIMRQLYRQVGGYAKHGDMPVLLPSSVATKDRPAWKGEAFATTRPNLKPWENDPNQGGISLSPALQKALLNEKDPRHEQALGALVHELAHALQSQETYDLQLQEGGAEAFARAVSPRAVPASGLGWGFYDGSPAYNDPAREAATRGYQWLLGGQFR